jgi:hypothetical protein
MKFVLLSALVSLMTVCHQVSAADTCSDFTISGSEGANYTKPASTTFAVSRGVVCKGVSDCSVPIGGYVIDHRTTNLTSLSLDWVFQLVSNTTGYSFSTTLTGAIENTTALIPAGTSGYTGFTPTHRCTSGRLSNCSNHDLEGLVIEACTPIAVTNNGVDGVLAAVATSQSTAEALVCNPANTSLASSGNGTSFCMNPTNSSLGDPTSPDLGGGAGISRSASTGLFVVALLVAIMGI